jgi:thiol-disulfide isomerase/thioredoxin
MKKFIMVFCYVLAANVSHAQEIEIKKFADLDKLIKTDPSEILIVNFWATWCAPCVKELPLFEALTAKNDPRIKVVLVNLDFAEKIDKVKSFVSRKNIRSEVFLLDEIDYNEWIDKVDPSWQGAIPATLVRSSKTGQRKFIAKELGEGDLERVIQEL